MLKDNSPLSAKTPYTYGSGLSHTFLTAFTLAAFYTEPPVPRATMSVTCTFNTVRLTKICPRTEYQIRLGCPAATR